MGDGMGDGMTPTARLCDTAMRAFRETLDGHDDPVMAYFVAIQHLFGLQMDLLAAIQASGRAKEMTFNAAEALAHITCERGRDQTSFEDRLARLVFENVPIVQCFSVLIRTSLRKEAVLALANEDPTREDLVTLNENLHREPGLRSAVLDTLRADANAKRQVWKDRLLALA